jgi:hypothetical protein
MYMNMKNMRLTIVSLVTLSDVRRIRNFGLLRTKLCSVWNGGNKEGMMSFGLLLITMKNWFPP